MVGTFAILLLCGAGLALILGKGSTASRLFWFGIGIAVLGPIMLGLASQILGALSDYIGLLVPLFVVVLLFAGIARYRRERRNAQKDKTNQPTSLKRRVRLD